MCGLSLAWVTSENSTMLLESDILRLFFTGPYLVSSPLCSGVWCWLPLRGSTPTSLFASLLSSLNCSPWSPAATASLGLLPPTAILGSNYQLPLSGSRRQLSFASPYHFRVRRDFMSKNPLSGFAPKQTIESSALAAYPHSATGQNITLKGQIITAGFCCTILRCQQRNKAFSKFRNFLIAFRLRDIFRNIVTEAIFTKREMNNDGNVNFLINSPLAIQYTYFTEFFLMVEESLKLLFWHSTKLRRHISFDVPCVLRSYRWDKFLV